MSDSARPALLFGAEAQNAIASFALKAARDHRQDITWCSDPAASGHRARAFALVQGRAVQLIAYDEGDWSVRDDRNAVVAEGNEDDLPTAQARAIAVASVLFARWPT